MDAKVITVYLSFIAAFVDDRRKPWRGKRIMLLLYRSVRAVPLLMMAWHILIVFTVSVMTDSFSVPKPNQNYRRGFTIVLYATSSSDLKQDGERNTTVVTSTRSIRKFSKDSIVTRLKQAAIRASAATKTEKVVGKVDTNMKIIPSMNSKPIVTLRQLTAEIDTQLHHSLPWEQYHAQISYRIHRQQFQNQRPQLSSLPRDSMAAIVTHNYQNKLFINGSQDDAPAIITHEPNFNMTTTTVQRISALTSTTTVRHVAIVLAKKSMVNADGKRVLTVECAMRIDRLVHAIYHEAYKPNVIIFVGEMHTDSMNRLNTTTTNIICNDIFNSDGDLAYEYFMKRSISESNAMLPTYMHNSSYHIERSGTSGIALGNIAAYIQHNQVLRWLDEATAESENSLQIAVNSSSVLPPYYPQRRRWKLHVQFALISSDYHLCILNDIHVRSPGQSSLRSLSHWTLSSILKNNSVDSHRPSNYYTGIQLETSWTFMYALTASIARHRSRMFNKPTQNDTSNKSDSHIAIALFASNCYRRAQDLIPVLCNLRGIVANTEFFQRENYHVLVQARRSLVSDMEQLYQQQPSLTAIHKVLTPLHHSQHHLPTSALYLNESTTSLYHSGRKPLDVVLEGALLSLGRCLDLVRPAGLLTGSVPPQDFKLALMVLDQAVMQLSVACDPDHPLILE